MLRSDWLRYTRYLFVISRISEVTIEFLVLWLVEMNHVSCDSHLARGARPMYIHTLYNSSTLVSSNDITKAFQFITFLQFFFFAVPGAPQSLFCQNRTTSQIKVSWDAPVLTNGVLSCYQVTVKGLKGEKRSHWFYVIKELIIWHRLLPLKSRAVISCWRGKISPYWPRALWKLLMPCEQKQTKNPKIIMFKKCLCLKTKQNTEMSDEDHSDSELNYPEKQETAERKAIVVVVGILTKLKQAEIPVWKVSSGCIDFRNKKVPYSLSLGQYSKASVWYFTVKTERWRLISSYCYSKSPSLKQLSYRI